MIEFVSSAAWAHLEVVGDGSGRGASGLLSQRERIEVREKGRSNFRAMAVCLGDCFSMGGLWVLAGVLPLPCPLPLGEGIRFRTGL